MKLHAHKKNGLFGHAINLKPCTSILNVIITQQCGCLIRETGKKKILRTKNWQQKPSGTLQPLHKLNFTDTGFLIPKLQEFHSVQ